MLSRKFIEKLKLSETPQYRIALRAGVSPTQLSKWAIGAQPAGYGTLMFLRWVSLGPKIKMKSSKSLSAGPHKCTNTPKGQTNGVFKNLGVYRCIKHLKQVPKKNKSIYRFWFSSIKMAVHNEQFQPILKSLARGQSIDSFERF
jgi:hypothetical protein